MIVYNVLFKGVEVNPGVFAKVFATIEEAYAYAEEGAKRIGLTIMSESGFFGGDEFTDGSITDFRMEDDEGNSYYYVIYVQEMKIN